MISQLVIVLTSLLLLITAINLFTARTIQESSAEITESVACLIPMRNESVHAREVVHSALAQTRLHNYKVIAIDDHSTDSTREELADIAAANFGWFPGEQLPPAAGRLRRVLLRPGALARLLPREFVERGRAIHQSRPSVRRCGRRPDSPIKWRNVHFSVRRPRGSAQPTRFRHFARETTRIRVPSR